LLKFAALAAALRNQLTSVRRPGPLDDHLLAAAHWLRRAQDSTTDDGVAIRFSLRHGWQSSYPETTGYIIPTFLQLAEVFQDPSYNERAGRMARWEQNIQRPDGFYVGGALEQGIGPIVFDTGQIIIGLLAWHRQSGDTSLLQSAVAAGRALCSIQNADGTWTTHSYKNIPHAYHTRVAWPLAALGKQADEESFVAAACANIDWAISQQRGNGWFDNSGFTTENHQAPYTHTIAYTIRGILETGLSAERDDYVAAARRSADALLDRVSPAGYLPGQLDADWQPVHNFSCLTGSAQMAIIYWKLFERTGVEDYRDAGRRLNRFLCGVQQPENGDQSQGGAIAGSHPLWGNYERLGFPNWATKFFVDALLLQRRLDA